jgi:ribokinase
VRAARIPAPGETILGTDFVTVPGGKGANQAVAVAQLGGRATCIGAVGDDGFGHQAVTVWQGMVSILRMYAASLAPREWP